jgi:hypothetical protein
MRCATGIVTKMRTNGRRILPFVVTTAQICATAFFGGCGGGMLTTGGDGSSLLDSSPPLDASAPDGGGGSPEAGGDAQPTPLPIRLTLHWALGAGSDGAHVQICNDRACTTEVAAFDATGPSGAPERDLPQGVLFWRGYGRSNGMTGQVSTPTWQFTVGARTAPVDTSWGTTLDVNGDGYADVIVGRTFNAGPSMSGRAYLYLGSATGLALSPAVTLTSPDPDYNFGHSVASAGDVNGDGYADVIVGAYGVNNSTGSAYVYLGSATGLAASPAVTLTGPDGAQGFFGLPVASAGDVNGDGYADVIVGAETANNFTGRAYVYLGSATGLASSPAVTLTDPAAIQGQYGFGHSVAGTGDVNGDGYADVIVGNYNDPNDHDATGSAFVYLGSATGLASSPSVTLTGLDGPAGFFGDLVASAGDVNGDGYADVVVGAPGANNSVGNAYVYLGSATGLASAPAVTLTAPAGIQGQHGFGTSAASAGDVNDDGYGDVIIANAGVNNSAVYLYLGSATGLVSSPAVTLTDPAGAEGNFSFGSSVAGAGDVNGDGYSDIVVGAVGSDMLEPYAVSEPGSVHVYLGSATGLASLPAVTLTDPGPWTTDGFGDSVAISEDWDRQVCASGDLANIDRRNPGG